MFSGRDSKVFVLHVNICIHDGNLLPCKVIPTRKVAVVALNGVKFWLALTASGSRLANWIWASRLSRHTGRFYGLWGTSDYEGEAIEGRVHKAHRCIYIGQEGRQYAFPTQRLSNRESLLTLDESLMRRHVVCCCLRVETLFSILSVLSKIWDIIRLINKQLLTSPNRYLLILPSLHNVRYQNTDDKRIGVVKVDCYICNPSICVVYFSLSFSTRRSLSLIRYIS